MLPFICHYVSYYTAASRECVVAVVVHSPRVKVGLLSEGMLSGLHESWATGLKMDLPYWSMICNSVHRCVVGRGVTISNLAWRLS